VIAMAETVYAGLAVTSRNADVMTTADLAAVSVTALQPVAAASLPVAWTTLDIGNPLVSGSSSYDAGTYTVTGGDAILGTADRFHYAYRQVDGDIEIIARVNAVEQVNAGSKGGVMLRDALTPNAAHVSMFVTAGDGIEFQQRPLPGGPSVQTPVAAAGAPYWVRLERRAALPMVSTGFQRVSPP
jgi:hypothetical protein